MKHFLYRLLGLVPMCTEVEYWNPGVWKRKATSWIELRDPAVTWLWGLSGEEKLDASGKRNGFVRGGGSCLSGMGKSLWVCSQHLSVLLGCFILMLYLLFSNAKLFTGQGPLKDMDMALNLLPFFGETSYQIIGCFKVKGRLMNMLRPLQIWRCIFHNYSIVVFRPETSKLLPERLIPTILI